MKINIVYESKYGNGRKMLDELVEKLENKKHEVKLFKFTETDPGSLPPANLYIFHSPTRQFRLPPRVRSFIERYTPPAENIGYALSTTYLDPRTIALKKMDSSLLKKNMVKVTEDLKIRALGLKGPLEEHREKLEDFVIGLLK